MESLNQSEIGPATEMEHNLTISPKILEYVERVKNGETVESFGDIPESWKEQIKAHTEPHHHTDAEEITSEASKDFSGLSTVQKTEEIISGLRDAVLKSYNKEELLSLEDNTLLKKKEITHNFGDHADGVNIYNTLMDIGTSAKEGLRDDFEQKIQKYADEIKSGKSEEYVLGRLSDVWKEAVRKKVAEEIITTVDSTNDLNIEDALDQLHRKIRTDLENLNDIELIDQINIQKNIVYWEHRGNLDDDLFGVGKGHFYEDKEGVLHTWEPVDGEIGKHFDSHGIAKIDQLDKLLYLLKNGVDSSKTFYTAPFEVPSEEKAGMGAAIGTGDGTAYKSGIAVITGGFDERLTETGIKHVFINDVYSDMKIILEKTFPLYQFHLLSEQKEVLEKEALVKSV